MMKYLKTIWKAEKSLFLYWIAWLFFTIVIIKQRLEFDSAEVFKGVMAFWGIVGLVIYVRTSLAYNANKDE